MAIKNEKFDFGRRIFTFLKNNALLLKTLLLYILYTLISAVTT